jgi:hypothetical protein
MARIRTKSAGVSTVVAEVSRELGNVERTVEEREAHVKEQTRVFDDPVMRKLIGDILAQ